MDTYKESFDFAADVLRDNADGFLMIAYRGKDGCIGASSEDKSQCLPFAIASVMMHNESLRSLFTTAVAIYAKDNGNVIDVKIPKDPSLN